MSVLKAVFARCRVREGAQLLGQFFWGWDREKCFIHISSRDVGQEFLFELVEVAAAGPKGFSKETGSIV